MAGGCPGKSGSQSEEFEKSQRSRWGWWKMDIIYLSMRHLWDHCIDFELRREALAPVQQAANFPRHWWSWLHSWQSCKEQVEQIFGWEKSKKDRQRSKWIGMEKMIWLLPEWQESLLWRKVLSSDCVPKPLLSTLLYHGIQLNHCWQPTSIVRQ